MAATGCSVSMGVSKAMPPNRTARSNSMRNCAPSAPFFIDTPEAFQNDKSACTY